MSLSDSDFTVSPEAWNPTTPIISVVIPCFNYGRYLREGIESVLSQTLQDLEVIVVDDGSTDADTIQIIDELDYPRTTSFRQLHGGVSLARNTGVGLSSAKYICCLDADDTLEPTYLEKAVALLEARPLVGFAYPWTRRFGLGKGVWMSEPFDLRKIIVANLLTHPAVFRKDAWAFVGGFWEDLIDGYEDWEFWINLASAGFQGVLIPEVLFNYRKHGPSRIDQAVEKHGDLVSLIRERHSVLFADQAKLELIQAGYRDPISSNPFLNLDRPEQYLRGAGPPITLYLSEEPEPPADFFAGIEGEFWHISSANVPLPSEESAISYSPFTYYLPTFLPTRCHASFVGNFLQTRQIARVAMESSFFDHIGAQQPLVQRWLDPIAQRVTHLL